MTRDQIIDDLPRAEMSLFPPPEPELKTQKRPPFYSPLSEADRQKASESFSVSANMVCYQRAGIVRKKSTHPRRALGETRVYGGPK
jgi:hypothetical protein